MRPVPGPGIRSSPTHRRGRAHVLRSPLADSRRQRARACCRRGGRNQETFEISKDWGVQRQPSMVTLILQPPRSPSAAATGTRRVSCDLSSPSGAPPCRRRGGLFFQEAIMTRRHGRRRHRAFCDCVAKGTCYTTYDSAMAGVKQTPDAIRAYRGSCCGHYHITRYTQDEYAQRVAAYGVQDEALCDTVVLPTNAGGPDEADHRPEPRPRQGDAGPAPVLGEQQARLSPSPAALARFLEGRRD